jgi:hypothetical protein
MQIKNPLLAILQMFLVLLFLLKIITFFYRIFTVFNYGLSFFDLQICITPLVSSNSSCGCDRMVVGFTSTCTISAHHH